MELMNRHQAAAAVKRTLEECGASDYLLEDLYEKPERQNTELFELHHSMVQAVLPIPLKKRALDALAIISDQSDDLNRLGINVQPIIHENGSVRTDNVIIHIAVGRIKRPS